MCSKIKTLSNAIGGEGFYTMQTAGIKEWMLESLLDEDDLTEFMIVYDYKEINNDEVEGEVQLLTAALFNSRRPEICYKAVGSLVDRASDSRSEGLGSMPEATKYPPSIHGFHAEIVEVEIGGVAIYRSIGEFRRAKSYCHQYGAQGQRQAYF
ncbi:hypothetical protein TNCV_755581 [Trichonephila clavipes]|nr:hypothetical protein TNCV_755581 [Trichonephila clavipes]